MGIKLAPYAKVFLAMVGTALVTAVALVVGFLGWLDRTWTEEKYFVRASPGWRAVVPSEPTVSTRLYQLGAEMRYVLVLTAKSSRQPEAYYIDVIKQEIGVPDFGIYRPLWKGAFVPWLACGGFPQEGTVAADWDWTNDNKDLRIRIKGL